MCKVTVIMPSLNVAAYIRECMESVINQSLHDIEILAIDAGSTDGTLEVLQEYAERDSRVQLIHSGQKSYGCQVNIGIRLARGKYIGIVETDDLIEKDMYKILYEAAEKFQVDYVKGAGVYYRNISEWITIQEKIGYFSPSDQIYGQVLNPSKRPELFPIDRFLWLGLYRREFIASIRLRETAGAAFQDIGFAFQAISRAKRAVYLDEIIYYYREDNAGASAYDHKGFYYLTDEYAVIIKQLDGKQRDWHCACYKKMLQQTLGRFITMAYSGNFWEEAEEPVEKLRKELQRAVRSGYLTKEQVGQKAWNRLENLLAGSHVLYNELAEETADKAERFKAFMDKIQNRSVVIFGCGKAGRFVHALLEYRRHDSVLAYCDNAKCFQDNGIVQGIMVIHPERAAEIYPDAVYVITSVNAASEMRRQLAAAGLEETQIIDYPCGIDRMLFRIS